MPSRSASHRTTVNLDESLHDLGLDRLTAPEVEKTTVPVIDDFIRNAKVMIVDDEAYNLLVVRRFLQNSGYQNFVTTTDGRQVLDLLKQELPDIVLLDVMTPEVSGLEILRFMKSDAVLSTIPVIILTAAPEVSVKTQALESGATDCLSKPIEPTELVLRVRNVLAAKSHFDNLANYSVRLEREVEARTMELVRSRRQVIFSLARTAEFRDNETGHHVIRVGKYARLIALKLGFSQDQAEAIELAAQLHDVGKIGIPDRILHKPDKLDYDEFEFMKKHCGFGRQIIDCMPEPEWNALKRHTELGSVMLDVRSSPIMRLASRVALTHHERWDGSGYPLGLAGEDIPIEGRITSVADVFDALSSKRSYKEPFPRERSFAILEEGRGVRFDPAVLDAFFSLSEEIVEIQMRYADVV